MSWTSAIRIDASVAPEVAAVYGAAMTDTPSAPQSGNPGLAVLDAMHRVVGLAQTWLAWTGRPALSDDGDRLYTPNKAVRRHTDHLIDHLAEIEALLNGAATEPGHWHGSFVTLASDWAPFTEAELNEATQRLRRLGQLYAMRLHAAGPEEWDRSREPNWTLRAIADHVADSWYAEQVGDLREVT
jgi:hypothetical protein